jgi:hypothetical protein
VVGEGFWDHYARERCQTCASKDHSIHNVLFHDLEIYWLLERASKLKKGSRSEFANFDTFITNFLSMVEVIVSLGGANAPPNSYKGMHAKHFS